MKSLAALIIAICIVTLPGTSAAAHVNAPLSPGAACSVQDRAGAREIDVTWPPNQPAPSMHWQAFDGDKDFDWPGAVQCGHRYVTWLWLSGEVHPTFTWGP